VIIAINTGTEIITTFIEKVICTCRVSHVPVEYKNQNHVRRLSKINLKFTEKTPI